jgi:outer membrane lipoprotein-sorting protein
LLAGGVATVAISQSGNDSQLAPEEIIKKSQNVHASLSSYSDEGKTVSSIGSTTGEQDSGFLTKKGLSGQRAMATF